MYTLYQYQENDLRSISMEEMNFQSTKWLDLENPTEEELIKISEITSIPLADIKAYVDPEEIPRAIEQEHYTVVIFKSPGERRNDNFDRSTTSCSFLVSERLLITMHQLALPTFTDIKNLPEPVLVPQFQKGTSELFYYILEHVVRRYFKTLDDIEDQITQIESLLLENPDQKTVQAIFRLKRTLVFFHKAMIANRDVLMVLQKEYGKKVHNDVQKRFIHLYYDVAQLLDVIATYRDILTGSLDIYLTSVNNNMNKVMKKMAAYGTIVLVPTFIVGLYGMNFDYMPELHWKYGYPFALGLICASVVGLIWYFRRHEWF